MQSGCGARASPSLSFPVSRYQALPSYISWSLLHLREVWVCSGGKQGPKKGLWTDLQEDHPWKDTC